MKKHTLFRESTLCPRKRMGWVGLGMFVLAWGCLATEPVTLVDFTRQGHGWRGNPRARAIQQEGGFSAELTGADPWFEGPAVDIPGVDGKAERLIITLEADSDRTGDCQLFFAPAGESFSAARLVTLERSPDQAVFTGMIPVLAERMRFRIDPPGETGRFTVRALRAEPRVVMTRMAMERPVPVTLPAAPLIVEGGAVRVAHDPARWNAMVCFIGGRKMAEANPAEKLMCWDGRKPMEVSPADTTVTAREIPGGFSIQAEARDEGGALWRWTRRFVAGRDEVAVETSLEVSEAREVVHVPWLTLFAGVGTFGTRKDQALLPGVEYLEDEPSSNEKEVRGAAANRRIPAAYKICYPMMALTADERWMSMVWRAGSIPVSPLFDTPDRVFNSGGHVMGVWSPAVGPLRFESELAVYGGIELKPGVRYVCAVTVCGGMGTLATEAIRHYVTKTGTPSLPVYAGGLEAAVRMLSHGWLDSAARQGTQWRHAVWGDRFPAGVAVDAPGYLLWLTAHTQDAALKTRLNATARAVIATMPPEHIGAAGISHVKRPLHALLYGDVTQLIAKAGVRAKETATRLTKTDGKAIYKPRDVDYASTLGSDHCNGFTAIAAEEMLQNATLTGDETAIRAALSVLDRMTQHYAGQVPRGAQPWEMPLHTPDLLASARLVRCYVLGHLLSGNPDYLEQARYWAWTGVAMIYLTPPVEGPVGLYATIGVIGATNWQAPNWIGQPVQWCGLVYRSALEELARVDRAQRARWETLARGITIAGLQMCFPVDDPEQRGGLLPDYFLLKRQIPAGPAINPGTVQAHVAEAYGQTPMYTVTRLDNHALVHAPGAVRVETATANAARLTVDAWPEEAYRLLITRVDRAPVKMVWNGAPVTPHYLADARVLIVPLRGRGLLEWTW